MTPERCLNLSILHRSEGISAWKEQLLELLSAASIDGCVTYVVPGHPLLGDRTVQYLSTLHRSGNIALTIPDLNVPQQLHGLLSTCAGQVSFVDALSLVEAWEKDPFSGGTLPLSGNQATIVTNVTRGVYSDLIVDALLRRFRADTEVTIASMSEDDRQVKTTLIDVPKLIDAVPCYLFIAATSGDNFQRSAEDLQRLVARLRGPLGCPWDREQTHDSLTRNLIEESYELLEAIESGETSAIREELGDVLLQAFLHSQIAEENASFTLEDVFASVIEKLVRRHPHVFASGSADDAEAVVRSWDEIKRTEREARDDGGADVPLGDIPVSLPALMRAQTVLKRAKRAGIEARLIDEYSHIASKVAAMDDDQEALVSQLVSSVDYANRHALDGEALLRNWTSAFERLVARRGSRLAK